MVSLRSFVDLSSVSPARRDWLRRGLASLILAAAVIALIAQERGASTSAGTQRLGIVGGGVASPGAGQVASDFVLAEQGTGRLVWLSDYRGKTVVLNFWATWCAPCIAEMPDLEALHASHVTAGDLVVLAVNVEEPPTAVEEFKTRIPLSMPVLSDRTGEVRRHYGLQGLPGTFFIDRDGVVRSKTLGPITGQPLRDGLASVGGG